MDWVHTSSFYIAMMTVHVPVLPISLLSLIKQQTKKNTCVFNDVKFVISKYKAKMLGKKRYSYTALSKANVISMFKDGFLQDEVAEHFCIHHLHLSRWSTKEHDIMKDGALKH